MINTRLTSSTRHSNLLESLAIPDDLFSSVQMRGTIDEHPTHKTRDPLLHICITILLFMSAATVTTI